MNIPKKYTIEHSTLILELLSKLILRQKILNDICIFLGEQTIIYQKYFLFYLFFFFWTIKHFSR